MISGLVSLLAIVVALVVWGVVVHKWATGDVLPRERKQRTWLFVPTYVLVIIAAAGIGFLVSTILQPPAPSLANLVSKEKPNEVAEISETIAPVSTGEAPASK